MSQTFQIKMTPEYVAKGLSFNFNIPVEQQKNVESWLVSHLNLAFQERDRQIETLKLEKDEFWKQYQDLGGAVATLHKRMTDAGIGNPDMELCELVDEAIAELAKLPLNEPGWPDVYHELRRLRQSQEMMLKEMVLKEVRILENAYCNADDEPPSEKVELFHIHWGCDKCRTIETKSYPKLLGYPVSDLLDLRVYLRLSRKTLRELLQELSQQKAGA